MAMEIVASVVLGVVCVAGVLLTLVGLPGIWLMVLWSLATELWMPELVSWPAIVSAVVLSVLAEVAEFIAGAIGAKQAGGSKRAAFGAIVGGLIGAIAGTVLIPIPIVGTVLGSALGAGAGAAVFELTLQTRGASEIGKVATGAFIGRLLATVFKTIFAVAAAALLIAAVCVPGW